MTFTQGTRAIVIDASVAVEALTADPSWLDRWEQWLVEGAILLAPPQFRAEVANALLRSQKLPGVKVRPLLDLLAVSGLETADRGFIGIAEAVDLAEQHRLTVYDALYLQLALDIDGELATLDNDLRAAAAAEGLTIIT